MAPSLGAADTIRILVATDSHVGAHERDETRGDDSWQSFDEVMTIARERDVDMVLLAGDLFHDNKPSQKAMFQVMRSLRSNCLGDRPCELEMISDQSEAFEGKFNHINYEDQDINVSLPVFSIHGNHDDPSSDGRLASLDILQMSGLINYYGRVLESDKIDVKPILLQKGGTKLALYGLSNVRDERLYRTFSHEGVKFYKPTTQQSDWFHLIAVHQNRHAYTQTGYLPENFLPDFMDLVIWGHEHECKIDPAYNAETGFHVIQPGSSIATSLMPGEAVPKHVAIVTIVGRKFDVEPIRLKTVRPFVMKEIVLMNDPVAKTLAKKENNRQQLTRRLDEIVEQLIKQAKNEWLEAQEDPENIEPADFPKPLIRLRVEFSAPEGCSFDLENPQRFSGKWKDKVANTTDIVQFHRRKRGAATKLSSSAKPEQPALDSETLDTVKISKLVREYLEMQSLAILPQNRFGDAVVQFVEKDDKHAMEVFLQESLKSQVQHLIDQGEEKDSDEEREDLTAELQRNKSRLEDLFAKGHLKRVATLKLKPRPEDWDSDVDGSWAAQPGALIIPDADGIGEQDSEEDGATSRKTVAGKKKASTKKAPAKQAKPSKGKGKKTVVEEDSNLEDEDVMIIDDEDEGLFVKEAAPAKSRKAASAAKNVSETARGGGRTAKRSALSQLKAAQQSSIADWARPTPSRPGTEAVEDISDDDDSDGFEPMKPARGRR